MSHSEKKEYADFIIVGKIVTMTEENRIAEALAVKDDTILAVGSEEYVRHQHEKEKTTKAVLLRPNQVLMPGLIETHSHLVQVMAVKLTFVDINGIDQEGKPRDKDEVERLITSNIKTSEQGLFFGWDPELVAGLPKLSKAEIDSLYVPEQHKIPVVIIAENGHIAWANQLALDKAKQKDEHKYESLCQSGYIDDKEGIFREAESLILLVHSNMPEVNGEDMKKALNETVEGYRRAGITTATDLAYDGSVANLLNDWAQITKNRLRLFVYNVAESSQSQSTCCRLTLPFNSTTSERDIPTFEGEFVQTAGVKLYADGSPHSGSMAVEEEFFTNELTETLGFYIPPKKGRLNYITKNRAGEVNKDSPYLDSAVKKFHEEKKQIAIHCHGDRACEQVLSIFKELGADSVRNQRHRMEHLGLMSEEQIDRASELGICLSFNVAILYYYAPVFTDFIFGADRTKRWTPCKRAVDNNAFWTLHQDHPPHPGPILPFLSMKAALTRTALNGGGKVYGKDYRVPNIHDVLKAYTVNAAYSLNAEKKIGSLEVGKFADLVVLNQNPYDFENNKEDFDKIEVVWTSVAGDNMEHLYTKVK